MIRLISILFLILLTACEEQETHKQLVSQTPGYAPFVKKMKQHGYDRKELDALIGSKPLNQEILYKITHPAESKSWNWYRSFFTKPERIHKIHVFNRKYPTLLSKAEKKYGVSRKVISSILAIESLYGENTGKYRVLDALASIGFGYPKRSKFFLYELETTLVLHKKNRLHADTLKGSYAGAFGWAQFMPDSYRDYAVSYNHQAPDLANEVTDNVVSVANYLAKKGHWKTGTPMMKPIQISKNKRSSLNAMSSKLLQKKEMLRIKKSDFSKYPITQHLPAIPPNYNGLLIARHSDKQYSFFFTSHNFDAVLTYNKSPYYATMVYLLTEKMHRG